MRFEHYSQHTADKVTIYCVYIYIYNKTNSVWFVVCTVSANEQWIHVSVFTKSSQQFDQHFWILMVKESARQQQDGFKINKRERQDCEAGI